MSEVIAWVVVIALSLFGIVKCTDTEWYKAHKKKIEAENFANETPHKIRSADGCDVFAFETGGTTHYFTRCGATTTTERNYQISCNKNQTCHKKEEITTENKQ